MMSYHVYLKIDGFTMANLHSTYSSTWPNNFSPVDAGAMKVSDAAEDLTNHFLLVEHPKSTK